MAQKIDYQNFDAWSRNNAYRTSYRELSVSNQQPPKNSSIPGYGGFIPSQKSASSYGQTYTNVTKQNFSNPKLGVNTLGLSTNGLNFSKWNQLDDSKTAYNHKYGKSQIIRNHPCVDALTRTTHSQDTFKNPSQLVQPTYRYGENNVQFTKTNTLSGFNSNYQVHDGKGTVPHIVCNGDRTQTNYRLTQNTEKPIHRSTALLSLRLNKNLKL